MTQVFPSGLVPAWSRIELNGTDIASMAGEYYTTTGLQVSAATATTAFREVPARYGSWDVTQENLLGQAYVTGRRQISLTVGTLADESTFQTVVAPELGALHGTTCTLQDMGHQKAGGEVVGAAPGFWEGRLTVGEWQLTRSRSGCLVKAEVTLTLDSVPYMQGGLQRKRIVCNVFNPYYTIGDIDAPREPGYCEGGSGNIYDLPLTVGGNIPTPVKYYINTSRMQESEEPRIRLFRNNGVVGEELTLVDYLGLVPPGGQWPDDDNWVVDMATGEIYDLDTGAALYISDMSTDFFYLPPGNWQVNVIYLYYVIAEWRERYMI